MSQPTFAEIGGVTKKTQMLYENGERVPDAEYLAALAQAGLDVLYVLTGGRSFVPPPPVSSEHRALIQDYDACSPVDQAALRRTAAAMARGGGGGACGRIAVKGSVGQAVTGGKLINKQATTFNFGKEKK